MANAIIGYNIEAFGDTYAVYANASLGAQHVQNSLNLAKVSVFQFAYTEYLITDNWLIYMESYLRDKGLFKFAIKKQFKKAQSDLRRIIKVIETLSEPDYCNEYANQLYDVAIPHIKKLRDQIAQKLQNLNVAKPGVCATVVVLQNLICMAIDTFNCIFTRIQKIRHVDIKKCFQKVCPLQASKSIDDMLEATMGKDRLLYQKNIISSKQIRATFDTFAKTLYDPKNIQKAQRAAFDAMSDEQKQRFTLLEDGTCILKEYIDNEESSEAKES